MVTPAEQRPATEHRSRSAREVLVVGDEDWAVRGAVEELGAEGRIVHRCHDSSDVPFPCNALVPGRGCPLDRSEVDVVLAVRSHPRPALTLGEMGAICGLRASLPVVTAGMYQPPGLSEWAFQVPQGGALGGTCDEAARHR